MNVVEFTALLDERDRELGIKPDGYYGSAKTALERLYEEDAVRLFNGGVVTFEEDIKQFTANYHGEDIADDSWYTSGGYNEGAHGRVFIVRYSGSIGKEKYFQIEGYHDSWDNGTPDTFKATRIVEVVKVVPVKHEWKEVG